MSPKMDSNLSVSPKTSHAVLSVIWYAAEVPAYESAIKDFVMKRGSYLCCTLYIICIVYCVFTTPSQVPFHHHLSLLSPLLSPQPPFPLLSSLFVLLSYPLFHSSFLQSFPSYTFILQPIPAELLKQPVPTGLKILVLPGSSMSGLLWLQGPHPASGPGMHFQCGFGEWGRPEAPPLLTGLQTKHLPNHLLDGTPHPLCQCRL